MFLNIEYKNILTRDECKEISEEFHYLIKDKVSNVDPTVELARSTVHVDYVDTNGSLGFLNPSKSLEYLSKIESRIFKDYDDDVKFSNSYIRKYTNGTKLAPHIDKPGLDITLSVTIDGITNWPLCASNILFEEMSHELATLPKYQTNYKKYYTDIGDGVACYGRNVVHWRDTLICKEDEYLIQLFYHWTFI